MFDNLVLHNRSYRSFAEGYPVTRDDLFSLVGLARLSPSAGNIQPLKYFLSCEQQTKELIFPLLKWADGAGETDGEKGRPSAYICMFVDVNLVPTMSAAYVDAGIAAQTILLGACEKGLGGCIVTSFDRARLKHALMVTIGAYEPLMVIALGKPYQDITLEESGYETGCYRDEEGVRHVPKRQLTDIIIGM